MEGLHQLEIVILLLGVALALTTLANKIALPYPILLVLGGLALSLLPGAPTVILSPDLVFLVFLPPILWAAAYFTSWREFRANVRPISLLAVGLVLTTSAAVAVVARLLLPGLGWAEAVALGAIVSPPDAVSATAIGRRLRIPRRVVTILEGESLVNDATALILYRTAVGVSIGALFDPGYTVLLFAYAAVMGTAIGLTVALLTRWALCATEESVVHIAITLLAPYVAWVLGEVAEASAVLACVTGGLYLRRHFSAAVSPVTRLHGRAVWELLVFVLNSFIFILIGLQLGALREAVPPGRLGAIILVGGWVSLTAIVIRLAWVPLAAALPRWLSPSLRARDPWPGWRPLLVIGWTGMRGIVTLAAALALPLHVPMRAEIILISFTVILVTLVLQGLSLMPIIKALRMDDDETFEREEMLARERAAAAALGRLDELNGAPWPRADHLERLREQYHRRRRRFAPDAPVDPECSAETGDAFRQLRYEAINAERAALIALRNDGTISDEVLHRLEQELDLEAIRTGNGDRKPPA